MSFSEICDKFEAVVLHGRRGERTISSLCTLFKSYKKSIEAGTAQFQKAVDVFKSELPKESNLDTLSTSLNSLTESCVKIIQHQSTFSKTIGAEIIEPLELFLSQISLSSADLAFRGQSLVKETAKMREKTANSTRSVREQKRVALKKTKKN